MLRRVWLCGLMGLFVAACSSSGVARSTQAPLLPKELFELAANQCGSNPSDVLVQERVGVCVGQKGSKTSFKLKVEDDAGLVVSSHTAPRSAESVTLCWLPYGATYAHAESVEFIGLTDFKTFTTMEDDSQALVKVTARAATVSDLRVMLDSFNLEVRPFLNQGPFLKECIESPSQVS